MALRIVGRGTLGGRDGVYWRVNAKSGDVLIYEENMKIKAPRQGEAVVLTHEYGRGGLIVTCCRSTSDPGVLDAGPGSDTDQDAGTHAGG